MHPYSIVYNIHTVYERSVKKAFYQLLVIPQNNAFQKVISMNTQSNLKDFEHITNNILGFPIIQYSTQNPIQQFDFRLEVEVEMEDINPYGFTYETPDKEHVFLQNDVFQLENWSFLLPTLLTTFAVNSNLEWMLYKENQQLFDFLLQLNQGIHNTLHYKTGVTNTDTSAQDAFALKSGVCQDYAHLFIAIARKNGIPTRYTSGYLNQGGGHLGTSQTHAWIEAFIPFVGWVGFDPTNNLLVDHHYIKIAHGTDYNDCSPITGILETNGQQKNTHIVSVINQ